MAKDVHTEHCCIVHRCKYGKDNECTVVQKRQPQSYPCEYCSEEGMDPTKETPETSIYNFRTGHYYNFRRSKDGNPALLYIMGFMKNSKGEARLICETFMISDFLQTGKIDFISTVQGVYKILESQWEEITKEKFEQLKEQYTKEVKEL